MTLPILDEDALRSEADGTSIRISLPWIRSLPLASLSDLAVAVDGVSPDAVRLRIGARDLAPAALPRCTQWWFIQDRVVLAWPGALAAGPHRVSVSFRLRIPYLPGGDGPLVLPFREERVCVLDALGRRDARRDVA